MKHFKLDGGLSFPVLRKDFRNGQVVEPRLLFQYGHQSSYGADRRGGRKHAGIDIVARPGTAVLAMRDFRFIRSGLFIANTKAMYSVFADDNYFFRYAEIEPVVFKQKQIVHAGAKIGHVVELPKARFPRDMLHLEVFYRDRIKGKNLVTQSYNLTNSEAEPFYRSGGLIDATKFLTAVASELFLRGE